LMIQQNHFQICIQQNFRSLSKKSFFPCVNVVANIITHDWIRFDRS